MVGEGLSNSAKVAARLNAKSEKKSGEGRAWEFGLERMGNRDAAVLLGWGVVTELSWSVDCDVDNFR